MTDIAQGQTGEVRLVAMTAEQREQIWVASEAAELGSPMNEREAEVFRAVSDAWEQGITEDEYRSKQHPADGSEAAQARVRFFTKLRSAFPHD